MNEDRPRIYSIPDNFIDESRIINGMFKTRNFVEGTVMGLLAAVPALFVQAEFRTKVMIIVAFAAPFFLLGNNGFNGDPISTTLKNAYTWLRKRRVMLYNSNSRALRETPLAAMMEEPAARDKILDLVDVFRENRKKRAAAIELIEGKTFEFAVDSDLAGIYAEDAVSLELDDDSFIPKGVTRESETGDGPLEYERSQIARRWDVTEAKAETTNRDIAIDFDADIIIGDSSKPGTVEIEVDDGQNNNPFSKGVLF